MGLEKTTKEDKIEVVDLGDWKCVNVRTATIIMDDGAEISRSFTRHSIFQTGDWSNASAEVKAICEAVHNDTTKAAFKAHEEAEVE